MQIVGVFRIEKNILKNQNIKFDKFDYLLYLKMKLNLNKIALFTRFFLHCSFLREVRLVRLINFHFFSFVFLHCIFHPAVLHHQQTPPKRHPTALGATGVRVHNSRTLLGPEKQTQQNKKVADDPETLRIKQNTKNISNVAYHGDLQKKAAMERQRECTEIIDSKGE